MDPNEPFFSNNGIFELLFKYNSNNFSLSWLDLCAYFGKTVRLCHERRPDPNKQMLTAFSCWHQVGAVRTAARSPDCEAPHDRDTQDQHKCTSCFVSVSNSSEHEAESHTLDAWNQTGAAVNSCRHFYVPTRGRIKAVSTIELLGPFAVK